MKELSDGFGFSFLDPLVEDSEPEEQSRDGYRQCGGVTSFLNLGEQRVQQLVKSQPFRVVDGGSGHRARLNYRSCRCQVGRETPDDEPVVLNKSRTVGNANHHAPGREVATHRRFPNPVSIEVVFCSL